VLHNIINYLIFKFRLKGFIKEMELNREEVGKRLEEFARSRFILLKDFAEAVGIASSNLKTHYFTGKNLPGSEMIAKLISLGCNIHWLYFGKYNNPVKEHVIENKVTKLKKEISNLKEENENLRNSLKQISSIIKSTKKQRPSEDQNSTE
jgi:hypothetical protein